MGVMRLPPFCRADHLCQCFSWYDPQFLPLPVPEHVTLLRRLHKFLFGIHQKKMGIHMGYTQNKGEGGGVEHAVHFTGRKICKSNGQ